MAIKSYHFGARRHRKHALTAAAASQDQDQEQERFSSRRASGWHAHSRQQHNLSSLEIEREGRG